MSKDRPVRSNLGKRNIFQLKDWCRSNGYPGVTKECMLSAEGSPDPAVKKLARKERMKNIVK